MLLHLHSFPLEECQAFLDSFVSQGTLPIRAISRPKSALWESNIAVPLTPCLTSPRTDTCLEDLCHWNNLWGKEDDSTVLKKNAQIYVLNILIRKHYVFDFLRATVL